MSGGKTLWDQLIDGVGDAVTDIREKLVEEPWFGRPLTTQGIERDPASPDRLPERDTLQVDHSPQQDRGIDR